jgi:hypothetical protein
MKTYPNFWFEVYTDRGNEIGTMTIAQAETLPEAIQEQKEYKKLFPDENVLIDMWSSINGMPQPTGKVNIN